MSCQGAYENSQWGVGRSGSTAVPVAAKVEVNRNSTPTRVLLAGGTRRDGSLDVAVEVVGADEPCEPGGFETLRHRFLEASKDKGDVVAADDCARRSAGRGAGETAG